MYVDNFHQMEQIQENNAEYDKWFDEVMINYTSDYRSGVPMSSKEYGDSLEEKLTKWLKGYFDIDVETEPEPEAKSSKRVWTEEEIKSLIQSNDEVLYGALKKLYSEQTADEQRAGETTHNNGVGFNGADSKFLSSVSEFLIHRGFLTDKQKVVTRKKLVKYNRQLTKLANM